MKRFRVTANAHRSIQIFNSAEALFAWHVGDIVDDQEFHQLWLGINDFIDVELIGFEFVNDGKNLICFNLIQVAIAKETKNEAGHSYKAVIGYINDSIFPLRDAIINDLVVKRLNDDEGIKLPYPFDNEEDE